METRKRSQSIGNRGFTLVELLVVIGIIAVLISVLLPALSKARTQSEQVTCQAMMRQVGNGFLMYSTEWKGKVYGFGRWPRLVLPYVGYKGAIPGYLGSGYVTGEATDEMWNTQDYIRFATQYRALTCPTMLKDLNSNTGRRNDPRTVAVNRALSDYNPTLAAPEGALTNLNVIRRMAQVKRNSDTLLAVCSGSFTLDPTFGNQFSQVWYVTDAGGDGYPPRFPHGGRKWTTVKAGGTFPGMYLDGKTSVLFFDGHVEVRTPKEMYVDMSAPVKTSGSTVTPATIAANPGAYLLWQGLVRP
jgi:prepilin-type N-terminal cleavage/methylation domain-containing protein/prepilin-type processing-associated H-X9-DG protein